MSITAITIENFKGITDPVSIPIRPITLLFGKNSAGKSTLLQALHYLREVLEHRQPDPDRTHIGGDAIDLGGFQTLVHGHQLDRRIRIRVAFSLGADGIPNNGIIALGGDVDLNRRLKEEPTWFDLNRELTLESAWVEVSTAWNEGHGAYIAEYAVGLNSDEFVRMNQVYPGIDLKMVNVNFNHALVREINDGYEIESYSQKKWPINERNSIVPEPDKPLVVDDYFFPDKDSN